MSARTANEAAPTRIVVIGASAGGIEALLQLVKELPAELPAAILVVVHISPSAFSRLPQILARAGTIPAEHARHGDPLVPGRIYVAPPDYHLIVQNGRAELSHGPRENRTRPAADPLFRSAARWHGERVIGVVLSGVLDDGSLGLAAIKEQGGVALVQDPDEALFSGMPSGAIRRTLVDAVLPVAGIAREITRLVEANSTTREAKGLQQKGRTYGA